ncbi:hypothetical protein T10_6256 [Trichinella papuae]|uniref:Uncharacterized protein n=1 Tax=Trichinella papuae TaxID=268474 RepID=A0A0V1MUN1_9BILA|nr:hypothetical protein T10_6256 [Trichinella papuae]
MNFRHQTTVNITIDAQVRWLFSLRAGIELNKVKGEKCKQIVRVCDACGDGDGGGGGDQDVDRRHPFLSSLPRKATTNNT